MMLLTLSSVTAQQARTRGLSEATVQRLDDLLDMSDLDEERPHVDPSVEGEPVVVPSATTSQRDPHYHRPSSRPMRAACQSMGTDGQRLSRKHAEGLGIEPCGNPRCFGGGDESDA